MGKKYLIWVVGAFATIIILHYTGVLAPFEHGVLSITSPIIRALSRAGGGVKSIGAYAAQKKELLTKIIDLEQRLQKAQHDAAERQLLEAENQELRQLLNFNMRSRIQPILAYVVGKTIDNTANTILIDRGENDGIEIGNPVIVGDGIMVGKIAKVNPRTSSVRLINDPQSKITATVLVRDKSIGIVEGGFGTSVKLTTVLQQEQLEEGALIVTAVLEEKIPRGLLLGTLKSIQKEDYKPFQEGVLEPGAALSRLTVVGVIQIK